MSFCCRYCNSTNTHPFLDLGHQALANSFLDSYSDETISAEEKFLLDLYFCKDCGLVQISTIIDPEKLFSDYIYFSNTSEAIHKHGKYLAESFVKRFDLNASSLVVEIASNDGTVLQYFDEQDIPVLGVEPAVNIAKVANENNINTIVKFFNSNTAEEVKQDNGQADIIIGRNVFAHVPEIHDFVKGLKLLLKPEGVVAIEAPYMLDFIEKTEFDTIYHEHVSYLSLRAMENLFDLYDMKMIDVEFTPLNGGSLIYFISHKEQIKYTVSENVITYRNKEKEAGLYELRTYYEFAKRAIAIKEEMKRLIKTYKEEGLSIAGYGASAKGMVLLMYSELSNAEIDFIVDRSEYKQNKFTPGSHIPVYAPQMLLDRIPDFTILLAWNLADEIIAQQRAYLEKGGKFIIPIPFPRVIGIEDL